MPKDVKIVILSGVGGGLVSWAYAIMIGPTFGLSVWAALPLCLVLGPGAALAAVYVLTPTDISQTGKLIGYAVLCGFLWKPVLDAGRVVFTQRRDNAKTSAELKTQITQLKTETAAPQIASKAHIAADNAAELLRTADKIDNPNLQKEAAGQASDAINAIAATSTADPISATAALNQVRIAAEKSNAPDVANLATTKINSVLTNAVIGNKAIGLDIHSPAPGFPASGIIDWKQVEASGISFVFIRATRSNGRVDAQFDASARACKSTTMVCAAYHVLTKADPNTQVEQFLRVVDTACPDCVLAVDYEPIPADFDPAPILAAFLDGIKAKTGKNIVIYMSQWDASRFKNISTLSDHPLWLGIANTTIASLPSAPAPWQSWTFWQCSERNGIPGCQGSQVLSVFNGTREELARWASAQGIKHAA